jgi:uncharacterized protein YjiS (DUF1127 family)
MEMHSRQSLYEIHGISAPQRRQKRRRPLARLAIARILAVLKRIKAAIEAELAARHAITELVSTNDHMLRDLGITRSDIEDAVRGSRANVGTDGGPFLLNETGQSYRPCRRSALPISHQKDGLSRSCKECAHGDRWKRARNTSPGRCEGIDKNISTRQMRFARERGGGKL